MDSRPTTKSAKIGLLDNFSHYTVGICIITIDVYSNHHRWETIIKASGSIVTNLVWKCIWGHVFQCIQSESPYIPMQFVPNTNIFQTFPDFSKIHVFCITSEDYRLKQTCFTIHDSPSTEAWTAFFQNSKMINWLTRFCPRGVFIKRGTGNEEMGNGEMRK